MNVVGISSTEHYDSNTIELDYSGNPATVVVSLQSFPKLEWRY